jgi:two-component system, sensor histidine kinase and response regulator
MAEQKRLLLVDDEPRNLTVLESLLAPLGHEIVRADGGQAAIEAFETAHPDLILLDVVMPDFDGMDVLTHVRAHDPTSRIPVILVTGQAEREARLRGFEAGADEFLEKPVDRALLLTRVRTLLRLKSATDELVHRNAELEQLRREQRELTDFIVHDLKNPLAVVHMNLSWLDQQQTGARSAEIAEAFADAKEASRRLQTMIEELLAISRIEESEVPLRRAVVDVGEMVVEVVRSHAREAESKGISLGASVDGTVSADVDRAVLQRILENLVRNALQYAPTGTRAVVAASARSAVELSVSNTGQPIAEGEREHVFGKFRRGASAAARRGNAGLGLYFCKRAMEAHGGTIALEQTPDWPVSFVLRFPAASRPLDGDSVGPLPRTLG